MKDLAKRYKISARTLRRWRKRKGFPRPVRLNFREIGFWSDEMDSWVARQLGR